jgi:predicted Fe-Mo cluster-binding NifX family protein
MKLAVPTYDGRISPVMDTARQLTVVESDEDGRCSKTLIEIPPMNTPHLARFLRDLGLTALVCGAISRQLEGMLTGLGVSFYPWHCGSVDEVVAAHLGGFLQRVDFQLPGCRRRRNRRAGRCYGGRGGMRGNGMRNKYGGEEQQ